MHKLFIGVLCLFVALTFGNALVSSQETDEEMCVTLGDITLEPPESVEAKRNPVEFPHGVHFRYSCQTCHHTWEGDASVLNCTTSGCHDVTVSPTKKRERANPEQAILYYKKAYHDMCIGCHKSIKASNKKLELSKKTLTETLPSAGPTGCVQCHPKDE